MTLSTLDPKRWKALALLCAAQFIVILDTSIIGVALPAIQSDLGFTDEGLSWIFNAYVIAFGGLLLLGGKLADVFGARRIFMIGFAILTTASAVAGLAESQTVLLVGRAIARGRCGAYRTGGADHPDAPVRRPADGAWQGLWLLGRRCGSGRHGRAYSLAGSSPNGQAGPGLSLSIFRWVLRCC